MKERELSLFTYQNFFGQLLDLEILYFLMVLWGETIKSLYELIGSTIK